MVSVIDTGEENSLCKGNYNLGGYYTFALPPVVPVPLGELSIERILQKNKFVGVLYLESKPRGGLVLMHSIYTQYIDN